MAAEAMTHYLWDAKRQCAQILFIMPGNVEVADVCDGLRSWSFGCNFEVIEFTTETPSAEEHRLRNVLRDQQCASRGNAIFVVSTGGLAEDGWTIYINGVIDSGLMIHVDENEFLHVVPETVNAKIQRNGRAGRVIDGVVCCLTEEVSEVNVRLSYAESAQVTLAAASLKIPWPPQAVQHSMDRRVVSDLKNMGLLTCVGNELCTTRGGELVLKGRMDIFENILLVSTDLLGVANYGVIAAAYLSAKVDLFSDVLKVGTSSVLSSRQVELGVDNGFPDGGFGDVHTAVFWFLKWACNDIDGNVKPFFRQRCFRKMKTFSDFDQSSARVLLEGFTCQQRAALTIALAFSFQRRILPRVKENTYKSNILDEDSVRVLLNLPFVPICLDISRRSVCHELYRAKSPPWIIYGGTGRFPYMKSITPVPENVAAWFTHLPVTWNDEDFPDKCASVMAAALSEVNMEPLIAITDSLQLVCKSETHDKESSDHEVSVELTEPPVDALADPFVTSQALQNNVQDDASTVMEVLDANVDSEEVGGEADDEDSGRKTLHANWRSHSSLLHSLRDALMARWALRYRTVASDDAFEDSELSQPFLDTSTDDLLRDMTLEIAENSQAFKEDAAKLLDELPEADDRSVYVDQVKEAARDLRYTLEIVLIRYETKSVRAMKWRIKNYVYGLRQRCLNRLFRVSRFKGSRQSLMEEAMSTDVLLGA